MKNYQYQILRYRPDPISGEFANVGLIMYRPEEQYLEGRVVSSISRLSNFFPETDGRSLAKTLQFIEKGVDRLKNQLATELRLVNYSSLEGITSSILPKDDSALQFSEVMQGMDIELDIAFEDIYERLVQTHLKKTDSEEVKTDYDVWKKVYKNYFDKYGITKYLKSHTVETRNDRLEFEHAWQNGKWNCYKTVSFNLKRKDSIKSKVYKWDGILNELATTKEETEVYLLTYLPKHHHKELEEFIRNKLNARKDGYSKIQLVTDNEIDSFINEVKREIGLHLEEI
jgi:hypothetical protein